MSSSHLRYPIGKFQPPSKFTPKLIEKYISDIEEFPSTLRGEVESLSDNQLNTPYRPGGWSVRQVVHHCADSHMNSMVRFKLALTEDKPAIKPYFEARWAELADSNSMPVGPALDFLDGLHARWVFLLRSLGENDFKKTFIHPEQGRDIRLDVNLALYAWHGKHHLAHITSLKKKKGWD